MSAGNSAREISVTSAERRHEQVEESVAGERFERERTVLFTLTIEFPSARRTHTKVQKN